MVVGSFTDEMVYSLPLERLWKANGDTHNLIPKIMPGSVSSIDVLEGSGGVGTVKKFNFTEAVKDFSFMKTRIDAVDDAKYVFKYTVIDGGLVGVNVKWYSFEMKFEATADGGSLSKIKVEYDSLGDSLLTEDEIAQIKAGNQGMVKAVEGYLQANPDAYA
ncbi:class-10 pathogenesis-related protein 1-like [Tasmannia lanceolata]|uniref:class-10 pathogenesis-related protein 1-like n=1 Tax=Tasmannia lanceolata TaxID=3420 RepID=UPI0040640DB1